MASIAITLRKEVKKDGTYPIVIRITKDRKTSYIYTEYSVKESEWDRKKSTVKTSHPNSARLNNYLRKKLSEVTDSALELETTKAHVTSASVRQRVRPQAGLTFFPQAQLYLERLKAEGKFNRYSADCPRVERFKEFLKHDTAFADISIGMIERFKSWLKAGRNVTERTAVNHLVVLRCIYSQAIKEGACDLKYYPFGKGKIKIKFPDSSKAGLSHAEIKLLEELELSAGEAHARNLFLFSFYLAGVRMSDVLRLKWQDISDGRLWYIMGKNNKGGSLKIPEKALHIIDKYRGDAPTHGLIFPDLKSLENLDDQFDVQRRIKTRVKSANNYLKDVAAKAKISKKITCHISRHTFGGLAGDKIDIRTLQMLYRHSDLKTTLGYQANFIHKGADDALDAVLNS